MAKKWFILIVKTRNELNVAERLASLNIDVFCPTNKEVRVWSDRKKTIHSPLFKSYVFVRLTEKERQSVFAVPGIVRYLYWLGRPAVIRDEEMAALKDWLTKDNVSELTLSKVVPGESLTIKYGALKDQDAIVQEVGGKRARLIIKELGIVVNIKLKDIV